MAIRKSLSKKTRFEVFKRDSFTCQYCGRKAPEIILHLDHIEPVSKGGDNSVLNLLTSCFDCNSGKSNRKLDDRSVIEKQHQQLEELNHRREQLEMLLKWRDSLNDFTEDQVDKIVIYLEAKMQGYGVLDSFKLTIKNWIKKYPFESIFDAIDESASRYIFYTKDKIDKEGAEEYLNKISGILYFKSLPPLEQKISWIKVIAAKKFSRPAWHFQASLKEYVDALRKAGWLETAIIDDLQTEVRDLVNKNYYGNSFLDALDEWTSDIGKWRLNKRHSAPQKTANTRADKTALLIK